MEPRAQTRAHRGEGTRSPDTGTQVRGHTEPRSGHTGERGHRAQSPDAGTGSLEPRRGHTGERAHGAQMQAHRERAHRAWSPDAGTQGRGHTEPRRGHTGERAHGAQIPEPRQGHVYKAPSVLRLWDSVLKMSFVLCPVTMLLHTRGSPPRPAPTSPPHGGLQRLVPLYGCCPAGRGLYLHAADTFCLGGSGGLRQAPCRLPPHLPAAIPTPGGLGKAHTIPRGFPCPHQTSPGCPPQRSRRRQSPGRG